MRSRLYDQIEDVPLIHRIHSLVDLVHDTKRTRSSCLQRQKVEHGGHTSLSSTLALSIQSLQLFVVTKFDTNHDAIFGKIFVLFEGHFTSAVHLSVLREERSETVVDSRQ